MATKILTDHATLKLLADSDQECDMPACHAVAIFARIEPRGGHAYITGYKCGFHGAALYGERKGQG